MGATIPRKDNTAMENWYTLHTKPNQETRVISRLEDLDIQTFLPLIWRTTRAGTRRQAAFFPCYLFAQLDLGAVAAARWQWTPGLRHIVSYGGVPAVVPPSVIELIQIKVERTNADLLSARSRFKPGDPVRVARGPMTDIVALFERECSPAERVSILLTFLGRTCRVEVNAADLERSASRPALVEDRPPRRTRGHGRRIGYQPDLS
jgi:transcriptional antiterminator RfaH